MKKLVSLFLVIMMLVSVPAFAAEPQIETVTESASAVESTNVADEMIEYTADEALVAEQREEVQEEIASIEEESGNSYTLKSECTKKVSNYNLEIRFYAENASVTRAATHTINGVAVHTWNDLLSPDNSLKVYFYATFTYDGEKAYSDKNKNYARLYWINGKPATYFNLDTDYDAKNGSPAKATCKYSFYLGGDPPHGSTIFVKCYANGKIELDDDSFTFI